MEEDICKQYLWYVTNIQNTYRIQTTQQKRTNNPLKKQAGDPMDTTLKKT